MCRPMISRQPRDDKSASQLPNNYTKVQCQSKRIYFRSRQPYLIVLGASALVLSEHMPRHPAAMIAWAVVQNMYFTFSNYGAFLA